jgi:hypothetical protein
MHGGEALIFLTMFAGGFATIFGIYYLRTRQNLAMIDKGMNPKEQSVSRPAPYRNLKWAMLLLGSGVGLFLAYILDVHVLHPLVKIIERDGHVHYSRNDDASPAIYFSLIAIGGGVGLLVSYYMEKKWWDQNNKGNS